MSTDIKANPWNVRVPRRGAVAARAASPKKMASPPKPEVIKSPSIKKLPADRGSPTPSLSPIRYGESPYFFGSRVKGAASKYPAAKKKSPSPPLKSLYKADSPEAKGAALARRSPSPDVPVTQAELPRPLKIGYGTYGCVYAPPITCIDPKIKYCPSCVSKLMNHDAAMEELESYDALNGIDDGQTTLIKNPSICKPDLSRLDKSQECLLGSAKREIETPTILTYINGGPTLWDQMTGANPKDPAFIIKNFANVIKAASLLNEAGVYHLDIKEDNIVTGINGNGPYRLIDFGLMRKPGKKPEYSYTFTTVYELWPVDIIFLAEHAKEYLSRYISEYSNRYSPALSYYKTKGLTPLTFNRMLAYKLMETDTNNYFNTLKKVDVFSIGRILYRMSNRYPEYKSRLLHFIDTSNILSPDSNQRQDATNLYHYYLDTFKDLL